MTFDPNQKRGHAKNRGSWSANENGMPESTLGDTETASRTFMHNGSEVTLTPEGGGVFDVAGAEFQSAFFHPGTPTDREAGKVHDIAMIGALEARVQAGEDTPGLRAEIEQAKFRVAGENPWMDLRPGESYWFQDTNKLFSGVDVSCDGSGTLWASGLLSVNLDLEDGDFSEGHRSDIEAWLKSKYGAELKYIGAGWGRAELAFPVNVSESSVHTHADIEQLLKSTTGIEELNSDLAVGGLLSPRENLRRHLANLDEVASPTDESAALEGQLTRARKSRRELAAFVELGSAKSIGLNVLEKFPEAHYVELEISADGGDYFTGASVHDMAGNAIDDEFIDRHLFEELEEIPVSAPAPRQTNSREWRQVTKPGYEWLSYQGSKLARINLAEAARIQLPTITN